MRSARKASKPGWGKAAAGVAGTDAVLLGRAYACIPAVWKR